MYIFQIFAIKKVFKTFLRNLEFTFSYEHLTVGVTNLWIIAAWLKAP